VSTALKTVFREKFPRATEGELASTCESLRMGYAPLERWAWRKTLSKLYRNEERMKIELKVLDYIQACKQDENAPISPPMSNASSQKNLFSPKNLNYYTNRFKDFRSSGGDQKLPLSRERSYGRNGNGSLKGKGTVENIAGDKGGGLLKRHTPSHASRQRKNIKICYAEFANVRTKFQINVVRLFLASNLTNTSPSFNLSMSYSSYLSEKTSQ
jgi:hypothetical protein